MSTILWAALLGSFAGAFLGALLAGSIGSLWWRVSWPFRRAWHNYQQRRVDRMPCADCGKTGRECRCPPF